MNDLIATFTSSLERFLSPVDARTIDRDKRIPPRLLADLADLGAFGVTLPTRYGGSELGLEGACRVVDTLARFDRAIATTCGLHLGLGTRGLVAFGTDSQHERYLPSLATGERLAAFATTEPNAGSDLSRLETRATLENDNFRIRGEKIYVTNGGLADLYTISANSEAGRRLFLVERSDTGVQVGREEDKLGLRGSSTTPLHLDIELPKDRLLDNEVPGVEPLGHILAWGRTAMAAGCCGTAQAALDKTLSYVETRRQFGRPLSTQPVVRDQLAAMAARLTAMRALVQASARAADTASRNLEPLSLAAKVFASEGDWTLCDLAVQLHGGSGFIEETGVSLLLRDARVTRIFEGANDVLLTRLGQLELTSPLLTDGPAAAPLARLRDLGLKVLRAPRSLHLAGRLATLGLAHAALPNQPENTLSTYARALLTWEIGHTTLFAADSDSVCDAILSGVHA